MVAIKTDGVDQMSYIRKIRKPLVEKKRRERMNASIDQLKTLIAKTIKENTAPMTRVDKADILELTVYHLTQLQQQQRSVAMATEAAAYKAGYLACAREAVGYLSNTRMTGAGVTGSLSNHLHSTMLHQEQRQQGSNSFAHLSTSGSKTRNNRLSTPLRQFNDFTSPLPDLNISGCSPIQDGGNSLPELTSSFVNGCLNSSSSVEFSSSSSSISSSDSSKSIEDCMADVRTAEEVTGSVKHSDVVTIGNGKENEIGHVIKAVPWRPF